MNESIKNINTFYSDLKTSKKPILAFDYDGTLAPFVENIYEAYMDPDIEIIIKKIIKKTDIKIVMITGRMLKDLVALIDFSQDIDIWGSHGMEHKPYHSNEIILEKVVNPDIFEPIISYFMPVLGPKNIEKKVFSVAIHYRNFDNEMQKKIHEMQNDKFVKDYIMANNMKILTIDKGYEIMIKGSDKGDAMRNLIDKNSDSSFFAYFGDDITDEHAFRAIKDIGYSFFLKLNDRPTEADITLNDRKEITDILNECYKIRKG